MRGKILIVPVIHLTTSYYAFSVNFSP